MCFQYVIVASVYRRSAQSAVQINVYCDHNKLDITVYLPFVHDSITTCVFLSNMFGFFIFLCSVCSQSVFVLSPDGSPVASFLQDDGDVEDDMTIREVRQTHGHTADTHTHTLPMRV